MSNNIENITIFIDLQEGFARDGIPSELGGSLYVPGGENAATVANRIWSSCENQTFILTQDYHPEDHISFMTNHPGVMMMRERQLKSMGQPESEIMNPLILPFTNILIGKDGEAIGVLADAPETNPEIYLFTKESNRIVGEYGITGAPGDVPGGYLSKHLEDGAIIQTLWKPHCVQGTISSEFHTNLDLGLGESEVSSSEAYFSSKGASGNEYYVVRKGMNSEVDSYGMGIENDGKSETAAREVFEKIAKEMQQKNVTEVNLNFGGLATNFCVEFSNSDIHNIAVEVFADHGIKANVRFIEDISAGIPIPVPGGAWPDLEASKDRMAKLGTTTITSEELISELQGKPSPTTDGSLMGNQRGKVA